jgi:hypothetical protein
VLYPDVDNPRKPVRISNQPWHTAPQIKVSGDGLTVSTEKVSVLHTILVTSFCSADANSQSRADRDIA